MSVNPYNASAWIIVRQHHAYGPFLTKIDACDAAICRWGNDSEWDVQPLNQTLQYTAELKRKSPPTDAESDLSDPF